MINPVEIAERAAEVLFECGRKETNEFEKNNYAYIDELIFSNCRRHLMRWIYHSLVNKGKIKSIDTLSKEQKYELWQFVKEECAGKIDDVIKMKEICMVFTALDYFIHEKYDKN